MKKYALIICSLLGLLMISGCTVYTRPVMPPAKVEVRPKRPHAKAVWVAGHWKWSRWKKRYVWVPGHWKVKRGRRPKKVIIIK